MVAVDTLAVITTEALAGVAIRLDSPHNLDPALNWALVTPSVVSLGVSGRFVAFVAPMWP